MIVTGKMADEAFIVVKKIIWISENSARIEPSLILRIGKNFEIVLTLAARNRMYNLRSSETIFHR